MKRSRLREAFAFFVNDLVRDPKADNPTIGIILCKSKKKTMVEYALRGVQTPMGVSTYRTSPELPKEFAALLPSIESLTAELDAETGEVLTDE